MATFIGSLCATTFLLLQNYRRLGVTGGSSSIIRVLIVASCVEVWVALHTPPDFLSHLINHMLLAVFVAFLLLRTIRRTAPFVCDVKRHGATPRWQSLSIGFVANLAITGLLAKASSIS